MLIVGSRVNMAAGMFLFTVKMVKLLVLFVAAARFTVLFTARYAASTSVNIVDKRECCWCSYNELLWHNSTSLHSELTYISTLPAISAYLYRPTIVLLWSRTSGFPPYRP